MSQTLSFADSPSLDDLQVYLKRAARVEDGAVRLIASGNVLLVYSAILYRRGLLDQSPTVLGLRTFALDEPLTLDTVVTVRSLLDRIARVVAGPRHGAGPVELAVPFETTTVSWAGISPPRSGWQPLGEMDVAVLEAAARSGIDEVAAAIPSGTGEALVQKVRSTVWSQPIDALEYIEDPAQPGLPAGSGDGPVRGAVPAGAGFAAVSLGFLAADERVQLFRSGSWLRLSTSRGHVLVKS
ncbi:MAG: hypothetical protein R6W83_11735 [Cryobacterium sp.]